jgi:hypothetical protein
MAMDEIAPPSPDDPPPIKSGESAATAPIAVIRLAIIMPPTKSAPAKTATAPVTKMLKIQTETLPKARYFSI